MAYVTRYRLEFTNDLFEEILIVIQQKDGEPGPVQDYAATDVRLSSEGAEGKMTTIIGTTLEMEFDIRADDDDYWDDLSIAQGQDWLVIATNDGMEVFRGYVLPDEGKVPFQDRPYTAKIIATDGLGLLKDKPLTRSDGALFTGTNLIINYLTSCLLQTGHALPVRVYDNLFHASHQNRDNDFKWDWMSQTKLDFNTFKKSPLEYDTCYTVLTKLLKDTHRIFQWNGQWVVIRLSLFQYAPFVNYFTLYDYNGANAVGYEATNDYAPVGRNELIYAINEDQDKSLKFAVKSTKSIFNYNVWPEIPFNNIWERGSALDVGKEPDEDDLDNDGNTTELVDFKNFTIDDWEWGHAPNNFIFTSPLAYTDAVHYRHSTFDVFGKESQRQVILQDPTPINPAIRNALKSSGIPVNKGDDFKVRFDWKSSIDVTDILLQIACIYVRSDSGATYYINNGTTEATGPFYWTNNVGIDRAIPLTMYDNVKSNQWIAVEISPGYIPITGNIYIVFLTQGIASFAHFRNLQVDYQPIILGRKQVRGEYYLTSQNKNYSDISEEEIFISDNSRKILQGCLLGMDNNPLSPEWYRMGISESHPYLWFTNNAKFNHEYRRFGFVEGSFTGTKFAPVNDQENQQPMGLHKVYRLVDEDQDRRSMLTAPIEVNLWTGNSTLRFHEVLLNPSFTTQMESLTRLIGRIVNAVNTTNEAQWNSAGGAPAHGTVGFPPVAFTGTVLLGARKDAFGVQLDPAHSITVSVTNGLHTTTATITKYYDITNVGRRTQLFAIGGTRTEGDVFTLSLYGHDLSVAAEILTVPEQSDGVQEGIVDFKYIY